MPPKPASCHSRWSLSRAAVVSSEAMIAMFILVKHKRRSGIDENRPKRYETKGLCDVLRLEKKQTLRSPPSPAVLLLLLLPPPLAVLGQGVNSLKTCNQWVLNNITTTIGTTPKSAQRPNKGAAKSSRALTATTTRTVSAIHWRGRCKF